MGSIPLPALDVKPIQQPDVMAQMGNLYRLKAMQQQAALAPLQAQALQQQVQSGQLGIQQQQQAIKDQQAFRSAMTDPSMKGKTIGDVADALAQKGAISQQSWVAAKKADVEQKTALAGLDEKTLANFKAAHQQTQELYNNVMNMPDDQLQANWPQIAQQYDAIPGNQKMPLDPNHPMTKQQLAQFGPVLSMGNNYFDQELERRKKTIDEQTAQQGLQEKQSAAQFYAQNGGAPGVSAELMQQSDWLKKNPGKGPSDYKLWVMQHSPSAVVMGNQLGGAQNQDALDFAAENYRQTGQMPPGLYRSPGTVQAIIKRAAQLDQQTGGGGIAANKANFEANKKSLDNLQKNFDQVEAFEQTAQKNMDLLQQTAKNIPDLGSRWANVPVRAINANMIGTENMARFKTALNTAQTEAAKVLNSSNASGVLSDSARHELQNIIDGNMPYKAMVASLDTLRQDMGNRTQAYQMQISDIKNRIGGGASSQSAPSQPKQLDAQTAHAILQEAGGDKDKARALAKQRGYTF